MNVRDGREVPRRPAPTPMLLGREWVGADRPDRSLMGVVDPEDGSLLGLVPQATPDDAAQALCEAVAARDVAAALPRHRRAAILRTAAEHVERASEDFARLIAREGIKTIREARLEVARCVGTLRLCAEEAGRLTGETIAFDQRPGSEGRFGFYTHEPVGIVLAITPFNDPLNLVAHKAGPALAAGNAVILKPHEATPLSALALARAFLAAGLPGGMLQVLTGFGREIGPVLVQDDQVRVVSFTGGVETGRRIVGLAGLKKVEMELGSNCATLVLDDADIDRAAQCCVEGAFWAAGQNCLHVQRIIVDESIYGPFRDRLVARAKTIRIGPKLDEGTDMGCLIDTTASDRVEGLVSSALGRGADLLLGGTRRGVAFAPTLIQDVPEDHPLLRHEVYGPVTALVRCKGFDDAIRKANDTEFGLQAGVFTGNLDAAHAAVRRLRVGAVMVNDSSDYRLDAMPFGGVKKSGLGREGVRSAMLAMTEPKVACFHLSAGAAGDIP